MNNKGFSLVELIVVIAILAILVGVAVPTYTQYIEKAQTTADAEYLASLSRAAQLFAAEKGLELSAIYVAPVVTDTQGIELILADGTRCTALDELYAMVGKHTFATADEIQKVEYHQPSDRTENAGTSDHTHVYTVQQPATCVNDGWEECSCGATKLLAAGGHSFDGAPVVVGNLRIYTCTVAGCGYQTVKADGNLIGGNG